LALNTVKTLFPGTRGLVYRQPTSGRNVALILEVSTPMMMFIVVENSRGIVFGYPV
jgi:hypothetical protein